PHTSDAKVIRQVFVDQHYRALAGHKNVQYIVDCGANIGASASWLLSQYPRARLVAVEPDSGNMNVCRRNLAPFGDRAQFVESGVWSSKLGLVIERGHYRDGQDWSTSVRECKANEQADLQAVTIDALLERAGFPRIDVLKMDIERAELAVFSGDFMKWVPMTRYLGV